MRKGPWGNDIWKMKYSNLIYGFMIKIIFVWAKHDHVYRQDQAFFFRPKKKKEADYVKQHWRHLTAESVWQIEPVTAPLSVYI